MNGDCIVRVVLVIRCLGHRVVLDGRRPEEQRGPVGYDDVAAGPCSPSLGDYCYADPRPGRHDLRLLADAPTQLGETRMVHVP